VTNIVLLLLPLCFRADKTLLLSLRFRTNKTLCCRYVALTLSRKRHLLAQAAHRTPPGSSALRESEASATNVFCSESEASATNVLSVRKRSDSNKCFL